MSTLYRGLYQIAKLYWRVRRPLTLGVRAVVIDSANQVLLVRHNYLPGWHFPGGGVERGESVAEAAVRELLEEGGIITSTSELTLFGLYANFNEFKNDHVALYTVHSWSQGKATASRREITGAAFFPIERLPHDISAATQRRLDEIRHGSSEGQIW